MSRVFVSIAIALTIGIPSARAEVKVPSVFGSHMVLQRERPVPVWGTAGPGETITVTFGDHKVQTKADDKGAWKAMLPAMKANATGQKLIVAGMNTVTFDDVLVGEVWVGSGQSNMEWSLSQSHDAKEAIPAANHPSIRLFQVPKVQAKAPATDVKAMWEVCSPKTVARFSGVLYHFGLRLQKELGVPIGLINSSWGGSPIEPWTVGEKTSGGMYNAMIAPLQPFAIRGVCWYQGESNVGIGLKYREKMEALITGWRKTWNNADLPFYFVQIAPWSNYAEGKLPELWEAQVATLKLPHTGMVVMTDLVPNIKDIHPNNKRDVGNRLALWALAKDYGKKDIVFSGPLYKGMKVEGNKVRIHFSYADGLKARDGKMLIEFQVAGADGKFVPAEAVVDGPTVLVSSANVSAPMQVRFGWHKLANPNLVNGAGLPASPFQTSNWQGWTGETSQP